MKSKLVFGLPFCLFLILNIACSDDDGNSKSDAEPPAVTIVVTNPYITQPGSTKIIATATDDTGITKVEFYDEFDNLRFTDLEAPYELELTYGENAYGYEKYYAVAYDLADQTKMSDSKDIRINVERDIPLLEISLPKNFFNTTEGIVPQPKLIGAPGKSGTIYLSKHYGSNCATPFNYFNFHQFTDGNVDNLTYQFNNGETGSFSFSAKVTITGMPEITSNCLNFTVN